jgi:hypothetical protein
MLKEIYGCLENRVLRQVMQKWRKLHNEELHNMYSSPNMIRMITLRMTRSVGYTLVACMGR